jgi:poly(beta-D-mannuronate) lyase
MGGNASGITGAVSVKAARWIGLFFASSSLLAVEIHINEPADFKAALKTVQPGDELVMRDGSWTNCQIKFEAAGTIEHPITLRAQTPGKVTLTGNSSIRIGGEYLVVSGLLFKDGACPRGNVIVFRASDNRPARNCRLTDCAIVNYNPPTRDNKSYWVSLYGVSNRIDHCRFEGKNDGGPTLTVWLQKGGQPNYHLIDHNYFLRRPKLGRNGGETMRIGDSAMSFEISRTTVEYNLLEDCSGEAEYISNKSCENVYRYNTIIESKGALVLRHGNRNTVEGNWFFGHNVPGTGGIRIIGEDQRVFNNYFDSLAGHDFQSALPIVDGIPKTKLNGYFQVKRAIVAFNTFTNCTQNITFGIGFGERNRREPALDCVIANNIIVSTNAPVVRVQHAPVNLTWLGNIFFGASTGIPETTGVTVMDPKLARAAGRVAQGDFPFVTEDIEGRPRTGRKDVGCFQFSNEPARRKPLSKQDAGPAWTSALLQSNDGR